MLRSFRVVYVARPSRTSVVPFTMFSPKLKPKLPMMRMMSSARPVLDATNAQSVLQQPLLPRRPRMNPTTPLVATLPQLPTVNTSTSSNNPCDDPIPMTLTFTGGVQIPILSTLHIVKPTEDPPRGIWPVFRLMDENGQFRDPAWDASATDVANQNHRMTLPPRIAPIGDLEALQKTLSEEYPSLAKEFKSSALLQPFPNAFTDDNNNTLLRAHTLMLRLREMDDMLLQAQRQGRISFYMTCRGEEAIHMGAAAALDSQDPILAQYREQGLLMWRGFTLDQFTNQCFSNAADLGKGRQMPVHYGSRALQYHTVSSPLGTQIPQSVGVAYKLKLDKKQNIAVCFFGDGAASTPDFHSAMNMAATLRAPVVFICRNNGYAISTPVTDQYAGDGIVSRAPGYGMAALRVDGNDVFAMAAAVRHARAYALQHTAPVLLEAMTHRQGHHSTSDDSTRYRTSSDYADDPVERLSRFLQRQGWMTPDEEANARAREKVSVLKAIEQAERRPPPSLDTLFQDVYHDVPKHLQEQEAQLRDHIAKHPNAYNKKQS